MPVKEYKTRYIVFEVNDYCKLNNILREACSVQTGFFFKMVRKYNGVIIVKCPHKMVPIIKAKVSEIESQFSPGLRIIGVSGTLKKAISKFCTGKVYRSKD